MILMDLNLYSLHDEKLLFIYSSQELLLLELQAHDNDKMHNTNKSSAVQ